MAVLDQPRIATIYNPANQSKDELIDGFVVRQRTFKKIFKVIKESKMEVPEQHYLIEGRRGMGKTTLLLRLAYEIEMDESLSPWLIPIVFNEEEYGIRRLFNLWERILEELLIKIPDIQYDASVRKQLSAQYRDDDEFERAMFSLLTDELNRLGKKVVIFIDNFGDLAQKLNDNEAHRLRKILQTSSDLRIFAASSVVLESFYKYDHPFYEFFKIHELQGLNEKETKELLLSLSKHYKRSEVKRIITEHPGRVEALRRITGGVIRTMVLLFEIFADDDDGSAFKDLEVILDRTTPLYKHRMDDMSAHQQAIVEAIALNWDALSVKEIAERTRLDSKSISAQLNLLVRNGIIQKIKTKNKNNLYIVAERFFNIWFLMRLGRRGDENRVLWLVRFFEDWCDGEMMAARALKHRIALGKGGFDPEAALIYTNAMVGGTHLNIVERHELLRDTKGYLDNIAPNLTSRLVESDLDQTFQALEDLSELEEKGNEELAKKFIFKLKRTIFDQYLSSSMEDLTEEDFRGFVIPFLALTVGICFSSLSNPEDSKAEKCWTWAEVNGLPMAYFVAGVILEKSKAYDKAIEMYQAAIVEGYNDAMLNLSILYLHEKNDISIGLEWAEKAAKKDIVQAMMLLGEIYSDERKDIEKAIFWYKEASKKGNVDALLRIGILYEKEKNNLSKAIEWYHKGIKKGDLNSMIHLGILYEESLNDLILAKSWFGKAAENGSTDAMNLLAWRLFCEKTSKKQALDWITQMTDSLPFDSWSKHTAACVYIWNNEVEKSKTLAQMFLLDDKLLESEPEDVSIFLLLMLSKNEFKWLLKIFQAPLYKTAKLKDRFKPIYYALLKKCDHPDYLRMGEELEQTVEEVLAKAEQMAIDYA